MSFVGCSSEHMSGRWSLATSLQNMTSPCNPSECSIHLHDELNHLIYEDTSPLLPCYARDVNALIHEHSNPAYADKTLNHTSVPNFNRTAQKRHEKYSFVLC